MPAPSEDVEIVDVGGGEDDGDELGKLKRLWPHLVDQINARRSAVEGAVVAEAELLASLQSRAFRAEL